MPSCDTVTSCQPLSIGMRWNDANVISSTTPTTEFPVAEYINVTVRTPDIASDMSTRNSPLMVSASDNGIDAKFLVG